MNEVSIWLLPKMRYIWIVAASLIVLGALSLLTNRAYQKEQENQTLRQQIRALQEDALLQAPQKNARHAALEAELATAQQKLEQRIGQQVEAEQALDAVTQELGNVQQAAHATREDDAVAGDDAAAEQAKKKTDAPAEDDAAATDQEEERATKEVDAEAVDDATTADQEEDQATEGKEAEGDTVELASDEERCLQQGISQQIDSTDSMIMWGGEALPGVMARLAHSSSQDPLSSKLILHSDLCVAAKIASKSSAMRDHVLVAGLNENWGAMSTTVLNRTVDWGVQQQHWQRSECPEEMVLAYLNRSELKGLVTVQHQLWPHPKVTSLPLGYNFYQESQGTNLLREIKRKGPPKRAKQLTINNSGSDHRAQINALVIKNMKATVTNTFQEVPNGKHANREYIAELQTSKFVLCPSGAGWDSYRLWEVFYLGAIPIVERSLGFDKTLEGLPVLIVDNFDQINQAFLNKEYARIVSQCDSYNFRKLTVQWWEKHIFAMLETSPHKTIETSEVHVLTLDIEMSPDKLFKLTKAAMVSL